MNELLSCYGHYVSDPRCKQCVWGESCEWYTNAENPDSTPHYLSSLEAGNFAAEYDAAVYEAHREVGLPDSAISLRDLASFAQYLLLLDDLTLGIIQDVLAGSVRLEAVARSAGVSRQAVHRKVLHIICNHPELSSLFMALMPKLSKARTRFLRKKLNNKEN